MVPSLLYDGAPMDMDNNFTFRWADESDHERVHGWFAMPHVSEYWGDAGTNTQDFDDSMNGVSNLFNYWIGEQGDEPFCLMITTDAASGEPEHLMPHLARAGDTWTLDVLIGPLEFMGRGLAVPMLQAFLNHIRQQNPSINAVLIDPEANNPRAIHVYEKAGFRKVSEFTPTEGEHKGLLHILMALHLA